MSTEQAKATYTYKIKSDTGFCSESKGRLTVSQHGAVEAILNGAVDPGKALAASDLLEALAWMVERSDAGEFHDGKCLMAARAAIAKAKGKQP